MKNKGLFELRDNLIIRMLRGFEDESEPKTDFIYEFPFDSIADQKAFRETNNGILYLLHIFHEASGDTPLQNALYEILRNTLGPIEENKKIICTIFEDPEIIEKFFMLKIPEEHSMNHDSITTEQLNLISESSETLATTNFVEWYFYRPEFATKRDEVTLRIQKLLAQPEAKFKTSQKVAAQKQAKKLKLRKEKLAKTTTFMNKTINEYEEKRKQKCMRSLQGHTAKFSNITQHKLHRMQLGEEYWKMFIGSISVNV